MCICCGVQRARYLQYVFFCKRSTQKYRLAIPMSFNLKILYRSRFIAVKITNTSLFRLKKNPQWFNGSHGSFQGKYFFLVIHNAPLTFEVVENLYYKYTFHILMKQWVIQQLIFVRIINQCPVRKAEINKLRLYRKMSFCISVSWIYFENVYIKKKKNTFAYSCETRRQSIRLEYKGSNLKNCTKMGEKSQGSNNWEKVKLITAATRKYYTTL